MKQNRNSSTRRPIDILILAHEDIPGHSGLSIRVTGLLKCLKRNYLRTTVICPRFIKTNESKNTAPLSVIDSLDVTLIRRLLGMLSFNWARIISKIFFLMMASILCATRYRHKVSIVQCTQLITFLPAFILKKVDPQVKIVMDDINLFYIRRKGILSALIHTIEYFAFSKSQHLTTGSMKTIRYMKRRHPSIPAIYIANAISIDQSRETKPISLRNNHVCFIGFLAAVRFGGDSR